MKFSLAAQFLSPVFAAAVAVAFPSSVSVAEELVKKYDNHRNVDAAAASRTVPSRNLESTHTTSTSSKSSKSSVSCPPEPTPAVECGNEYIDSTIILGQNLICNENITQADGSLNVALTLIGTKAKLDCRGYTISQTTDKGSAAAVDCDIFPSNSTERLRMKQECDLYYIYGVELADGATMVNCNVQTFYVGATIYDGGLIKDSDFSLNKRGVEILSQDDATNTVSKVVNSAFYNNYWGLDVFQLNEDSSKVMIEDVTAKNNEDIGMYLSGTGITVNNANIKSNEFGLEIGDYAENKITLAGDVSTTNNEYGFLTEDSSVQGTVHVTGNLISDRNVYGVATFAPEFNLVVGGSYSGKSGKSGSGSLTACDNGVFDIFNVGGTNFEGSDYTCDTAVPPGADLPVCKPCNPGCPESSETSHDQAQDTMAMASFMAENSPGPIKPIRPSRLPMEMGN